MTGSLLIAGLISSFGLLLLLAAYNDFRKYLIPDWISIAIAITFFAYLAANWAMGVEGVGGDLLWALASAFGIFIPFAALFAMGMFGGGDVKLITAVALWAGPQGIVPLMLVTTLVGGLLGLTVLLRNRASQGNTDGGAKALSVPIPYGIAIAAGGLVVAGQIFRQGAF